MQTISPRRLDKHIETLERTANAVWSSIIINILSKYTKNYIK